MIHFETIRQIPDTCSPFVGMSNDDDFVTAIDELSRELINVAFNASRLGEKEVADHSNMVRHLGQSPRLQRHPVQAVQIADALYSRDVYNSEE